MPAFPLTPPSLPKPDSISLKPSSVVARVPSIFTLEEEVQVWSGQQRILTAQWVGQFREDAEDWEAFFHELNGAEGEFLFPTCWAAEPRGTGELATNAINAAVDGAGQTGDTINIRMLKPSTNGVYKKGDYIEIRHNYMVAPDDFTDVAWTKTNCTSSAADAQADPEGGTTAERITPDVLASDASVRQFATSLLNRTTFPEATFTWQNWAKAVVGTPAINHTMWDQTFVGKNNLYNIASAAWNPYTTTGTLGAAATEARAIFGGQTTWPDTDGAVDLWGASLDTPQNARLYKLLADVDADVNGKGVARVWPSVKIDHGDHARIIHSNPQGVFRLVDFPQFDIDDVLLRGFTMTAVEVVP